MHARFIIAPGATALVLGGYASMSKSQCQVADWQRVGFADGAAGIGETRLDNNATSDSDKAWIRSALNQLDLEQHRLRYLYYQQTLLAP